MRYTFYISNKALVSELHRRLAKGIVRFTYYTKDGRVREAIGTRNLTYVHRIGIYAPIPHTDIHRPNAYFDLEKRAWRSFCPQNLVSIDG